MDLNRSKEINHFMELRNIVPWGRSFNEYKSIFSLSKNDLQKSIIGCGDGPAAFNTELTILGGNITSIDPTYTFTAQQIQQRIADVYDDIIEQMQINKDHYLWDTIPSIEALGHTRMTSMQQFLDDFEIGKTEGRYVDAALPNLPFTDQQFDLALCSHYLFLYSEQVNYQQHLASLKELIRVAREVRIYPLIPLNGQSSPHLEPIIKEFENINVKTTLKEVSYRFQKEATHMLVIEQ